MYVYDAEISTQGLVYPRALKQTLVGVYMSQICLIGLFSIRQAFGPMVIMMACTICTVLVHLSLNDALGPLMYNLPMSLAHEGNDAKYSTSTENGNDEEEPLTTAAFLHPQDELALHGPTLDRRGAEEQSRAVEGLSTGVSIGTDFAKATIKSRLAAKFRSDPRAVKVAANIQQWISPTRHENPNIILKWLHPEIFADHIALQELLSPDIPIPEYSAAEIRDAYLRPSMSAPRPRIWIPKDLAGISVQEIRHTEDLTPITDEGVRLDEKQRLIVDMEVVNKLLPPKMDHRLPY